MAQDGGPRKAEATAWMDGLRGLAAIGVFNYHYFFAFTDAVVTGYGIDKKHHSFIQLPPLRLLYDGVTCVSIFFVIAGYVCSVRALKLMTSHQTDKALRGLMTSVFRRFFRLYMPVFCVTLMSATLAQLGVFEILRPMMKQKKIFFPGAFSEVNLGRFENVGGQLKFWLSEMSTLSNPWYPGPFYPVHDPHLWTIQFEFRMSMHLYIALVGLAMCKSSVRLVLLVVIGFLYVFWGRWEGPPFFFGAAIAQWDIMRQGEGYLPQRQPQVSSPEKGMAGRTHESQRSLRPQFIWRVCRWLMYALALYLMTFPVTGCKKPAPGYIWMNNLIPSWAKRKEKFPKSIGAILLILLLTTTSDPASSSQPSLWHRVLTSRVALYFGRIMFGLYLVHGPLLHAFGYGIPHWVWGVIGKDSSFTYGVGFTVGWAISLLVSVFVGDLFTRVVDARCARLIKLLEKICFVSS